jgi:hypothetical protein
MDGKKVLEWGVIAIVVLFLWRWLNALLARGGGSIQSSDYYNTGYPQTPYGVVSMYPSPVGFGPYYGGSWNDPGNYGGWYNGGDYPQAFGRPRVGAPGGSKRW